MKKIGHTEEGNCLVEMSEDELKAFEHLASAVEGKTIDELFVADRRYVLPDYTGLFGAIEAFTLVHYRVNDLQELVDRFRETMKG
jgi:hypothetical protein